MELFTKKFVDDLFDGKFGVIFSRANTRIKHFKKEKGEEVLIRYKDAQEKKHGIQILFDYNTHSYEIKYRGKAYQKLAQKLEKYFKKNKIIKVSIEEV
ncbi:MAG: hypothetical protein ACTSR3_10570 [Candidatus Helarchaeota archaeon]